MNETIGYQLLGIQHVLTGSTVIFFGYNSYYSLLLVTQLLTHLEIDEHALTTESARAPEGEDVLALLHEHGRVLFAGDGGHFFGSAVVPHHREVALQGAPGGFQPTNTHTHTQS